MATYPPDIRYADYFRDLERKARAANRGLWGDPEAVAYHRPRPAETPATATTAPVADATTTNQDGGTSAGAGSVWAAPTHGSSAQTSHAGSRC